MTDVVRELWNTAMGRNSYRAAANRVQWRMSDPGCAMLQIPGHAVLVTRRLKLDANPVTVTYQWEHHQEDGTSGGEHEVPLDECLTEAERCIDALIGQELS